MITPFLDQAVEDFGLDSILTDSIDTPDLDASFDEAYALPSVSAEFLSSFNTISHNSRPQLAPSIKYQIMVPSLDFTFACMIGM